MAGAKPVRKTTTKKSAKKTTRKVVSETAARKTTSEQKRKAPTSLKREPSTSRTQRVTLLVGVGLFIAVAAISVTVGVFSGGEITISEAVTIQREQATPEQQKVIDNIGVQEKRTRLPDAGLVGADASTPRKPKPEPQPTASSTLESASSTESAATSTQSDAVEPDTIDPADGSDGIQDTTTATTPPIETN